jgi:hypothetical protein
MTAISADKVLVEAIVDTLPTAWLKCRNTGMIAGVCGFVAVANVVAADNAYAPLLEAWLFAGGIPVLAFDSSGLRDFDSLGVL